jgi:endonuclease-3 related protein
MKPIRHVYRSLLRFHGPQGWWPIVDPEAGSGTYHLHAPRNGGEVFEISVGAILTQNVSWKNAEKALCNLKRGELLDPAMIEGAELPALGEMIRPAGYYNQKAKKLKHFTAWYRRYGFSHTAIASMGQDRLRDELLAVSGIGPETADSILLYALGMTTFVVDAYTKRMFTRLGLIRRGESYEGVRAMVHSHFPGSASVYNEFHALIVAHCKVYCAKRPSCATCCLEGICAKILDDAAPAGILPQT